MYNSEISTKFSPTIKTGSTHCVSCAPRGGRSLPSTIDLLMRLVWCSGKGVGLRLKSSRVLLVAVPLQGSDGRVVRTDVPLSPSSIIWYQWEGNRRSVVALTVRRRLHCLIRLRSKEDEHPTSTSRDVWYS